MGESTNAPLVSVIIATRDRQPVLRQTLPSVLKQRYPAQAFEVILVDDGSLDGASDWAKSLSAPCQIVVLRRSPAARRLPETPA